VRGLIASGSMRKPLPDLYGIRPGRGVGLPSARLWLAVECLFEGGEGGALGGGADFAVDVCGGVEVGVAEDA
jgi:hypothetical protein